MAAGQFAAVRNPSVFLAPFLIVAPLAAQAQVATLDIHERRLDRAVEALARQAGISIAIDDPRLAGIGVRRVRGRMTVEKALAQMFAGKPVRVRRINEGAYRVEAVVPRAVAVRPAPTAVPIVDPEPIAETSIVVTASKRDTLLADYPGAATIVAGGDITFAQGARGTDAIAERAAALTSTHLGPGRNKLFIRGIADSSFTGPTQATVGQYWGNTRVTYSAPDPGLKLYDVASVELLEGPQGTLYGAGALGGIIRIVPQAPVLGAIGSAGWGGVQLTERGDPGGDAGALINVPVMGDRLAFRGLVYGGIDGGYIDDRLRGLSDVNRVKSWGGRGALQFAPDAVWTVDLSGTYQSTVGRDAQFADRMGDGLSRESALAQPYANRIALGEVSVTGDLGATRLVSTFGIVDQHVDERFDATTNDAQPRYFDQSSRVGLITSETRLAGQIPGGGWLIGLNLLRNETRINREIGIRALARPETGVINLVEEGTLYGEATGSPVPRLALTAGARLTHSRLSGSAQDAPVMIAFRNDPGARASRQETRLLPAVAARYRLGNTISVFARYQEGYRPGGLSIRSDFIQRFEPDRVATVEAGVRYRDPGGQVALQLTLAATDWRDIQADIIDGVGFPATANIGDGRVHSAGASARWSPVPDLSFDAAVYWNDSKVTTPAPVLLSALAGARQAASDALPNVADLSARAGVDYRVDLTNGARLTVRGHARYMGQSTLGIGPLLGKPQGGYVDTGVDARLGDERRGLSLSITNLFDARGNRFALGSPFQLRDEDHVTPLRPRTIRLGFDASF